MRITGGDLSGIRLPSGFANHVRPTTDMMREAVFNKLVHTIGIEDKTVLDLFSGSGIVALEFASRGAVAVTAVDRDEKNIIFIKSLLNKFNIKPVSVIKKDVFRFLQSTDTEFDIIYADPPYDMPDYQRLADEAFTKVKPGGWLLVEHRPELKLSGKIAETRKHGSSAITIFAKPNP